MTSTVPLQPLSAHHLNTPPSTPSSPHAANHTSSSPRGGLSKAEAYASAHQPPRVRSKEGEGSGGVGAGTKSKPVEGDRSGHVQHASSGSGSHGHGHGGGGKPILNWISRKLGGGRRASIAEPGAAVSSADVTGRTTSTVRVHTNEQRGKYTTLPKKGKTGAGDSHIAIPSITQPVAGSTTGQTRPSIKPKSTQPATRLAIPTPTSQHRPRLSPSQIFPQTPVRNSILSGSEAHSLQSYSLFSASPSERERRREANNPYPSMPIHMYKGSIMSSSASAWASASGLGDRSVSFRTRSRSPSVRSGRSVSSSLRPAARRSMVEEMFGEDGSVRWGSTGGRREEWDSLATGRDRRSRTPGGADENASIRPIPPSHPSSPTPSQSTRSQTPSASLLSPKPHRSRSLTSPARRFSSRQDSSSSIGDASDRYGYDESSSHGLSRHGSASTKPTTIVSFDSGPAVAHIAQVAPAPATAVTPPTQSVPPNIPQNAVAGPSTAPTATTPPSTVHNSSISGSPMSTTVPPSPLRTSFSRDASLPVSGPSSPTPTPSAPAFQALPPKHTHPHPIHNPRPSSPPNDNASILTLASSTFAAPNPAYGAPSGAGSLHRPTSISRMSMISNYAPSAPRPGLGTSPSVTFAPIPNESGVSGPPTPGPYAYAPHRPSSLAPSHRSVDEQNRRPPSLASPLPLDQQQKEYQPSLHPTLGTRGSASLSHASWGLGRAGGVDEGASTRAMRRKGSESSVGSFESRWSWRGAGAGVSPGVGRVMGGGRANIIM
ncbi:uncharacterized protein MKK02DRAFT_42712 [Dioszegia hungarica]|uniref:Proteophosphoglycan ppg4 n=1 Tax=Dioszegia hungarica TaxID=4972 RepID=A0AA38LWH8_9TREE|nr:uncharacterized protein MKK02DRAFT_42712 [Dioszegia hungarica]KAI9638325.1 hypothetical protein MKK02DRAFT_42712 [Dioszegia hungarica]